MALINRLKYIIVCLFLNACSSENTLDLNTDNNTVLSQFLSSKVYQEDAIIACAASTENNTNLVSVYFYPEEGSSNFRLYATDHLEMDSQDFSAYNYIDLETKSLFNGALRFFETDANAAWFTVVYNIAETVNVATPIKNKKMTQPSKWTDAVEINQEETGMPLFSWEVLSDENNAIFFEVLANENLDLISGTYTYDASFQFYKLDNVVLNITQNLPTELVSGNNYIFTVMDVSLDNWVNQVIMAPFIVE
jgi:hypothetical protein